MLETRALCAGQDSRESTHTSKSSDYNFQNPLVSLAPASVYLPSGRILFLVFRKGEEVGQKKEPLV